MQTLSDLNALYNFPDTIILCKIFENRAKNMQQKFKFNPRKCSSASTLGGAIHRDMSKVIISFPTKIEIVELMEKALIGGINVVNTRIGFDTDLFTKNINQKLVYKIRNKNNQIEDKRIAAKILKMDENNQYGNAMTKPLPIDCIKKKSHVPSYREVQILLGLSHTDKLGHLFIIDIEFNFECATAKELLFNEVYTLIFEKKKDLLASERSVFQLLHTMGLNKEGLLNNYKCTAITHSTMEKKIFWPLYVKHWRFLITHCGWTVTKIYCHFTFEQDMFKKEFVISNQVARQNAKIDMEKKFYKVMNNSNFGYNCRNNSDNCFLASVIDELEEMSYIRKHQSLFNPALKGVFSTTLLKKQINEEFDNKISQLDQLSDFYDARKSSHEMERKKQLDSIKT